MKGKGTTLALVAFLVLANGLLAYGILPTIVQGWMFALGFLVPILFLYRTGPVSPLSDRKEAGPTRADRLIPWIALLMFLGAVPRFWRVTEDFLWPTGDEGLHGFLGLDLAQHWTGQFFYTVGEHPPLLIWSLAALFKIGVGSLAALWSLPALFSLLLVPFGYAAARHWFDRRWSLVFSFLMATSYWPLSLGRYCHQGLFVPFWELTALWGIGELERSKPQQGGWRAFLLGLWIGLGTLTFTAWWAVLFGFTVVFGVLFWSRKGNEKIAYGCGSFLGVLPFLMAAVHEGYGHHLLDSSLFNQGFDPSHLWITRISYITSLFWGSIQAGTSYGPLWGGMLNPILATSFWTGLVVLIRQRAQGGARILLFALFIGLLPGVLAGDYVELNRIIQVMPWVLLTCVVGLRAVLSWTGRKSPWTALVLILALSTGLDGWHYLKPVLAGEKARIEKGAVLGGDENFQAYQTLKAMASSQGPGILLTDFMPLKYGHTLSVAVHPFNAAENDRLDPGSARWMGLVTEVHFIPFLKARFPQAEWHWFGSRPPTLEGGMALGLMPLREQDRPWVSKWLSVHRSFHRLNLEAERSFNGPQYFRTALEDTKSIYPEVQGDRYLEAVYWEWVSQFNFGPDPSVILQILHRSVERGLPAAHLLEALSIRSFQTHLDSQAIQCHEQALRALGRVQKELP